jgi:hypothetical protein
MENIIFDIILNYKTEFEQYIQKKYILSKCIYVFIKGKNKDRKCSRVVVKSTEFCKQHQLSDKILKIKKRILPVNPKLNLTLEMNSKINMLWHKSTKLIFNSKEDKQVIGKYDKGKIIELDNEDITLCKKYRFNIDYKKVNIETILDEIQN